MAKSNSYFLPYCKRQNQFWSPRSFAMELYQTPAGNLDTFIAVNLQPNNQFLNQVRSAIHIICEFFRENCFRDTFPHGPRVIKVVKVSVWVPEGIMAGRRGRVQPWLPTLGQCSEYRCTKSHALDNTWTVKLLLSSFVAPINKCWEVLLCQICLSNCL